MSVGIEQYGKEAAFASLRKPPWWGLGQVFDKPVNTQEMLDLAKLSNWNLRFVDPSAVTDYHFAKNTFWVVRDNPFVPGQLDVLGTVGGRYEIIPNEEIFATGDFIAKNGRRWETAGSINGGSTVFATLAESDDIVLDPGGQADTVTRYSLLVSDHDGQSKLRVKKTNIRAKCKNTLDIALRGTGAEFKVAHTRSYKERIKQAAMAAGFIDAYDTQFEAAAKKMIETSITDQQFWQIVKSMPKFKAPAKDVGGSMAKYRTKMQSLESVWAGETSSMPNLDLTVWRGINTVLEWHQYFRTPKGAESGAAYSSGFDPNARQFRDAVVRQFVQATGLTDLV